MSIVGTAIRRGKKNSLKNNIMHLFRSIAKTIYPHSDKDKEKAPLALKTPAQRNPPGVVPVTPIQRLSDDPRRLQELRKTYLN
jgi:hypothetical protein